MKENHTTDEGDTTGAIAGAATKVTAQYEWPFQSHARMAPAFGLVDVRDGGATVWTDSQKPHSVRPGVADMLDIPVDNVRAIWMTAPAPMDVPTPMTALPMRRSCRRRSGAPSECSGCAMRILPGIQRALPR